MKQADLVVITKMVHYCDDILFLEQKYQSSFELYLTDISFRYSVSMCLMQLGELAGKISEETRGSTPQVPWNLIRAMRNVHIHDYDSVRHDIVWATITKDIPKLRQQLKNILEDRSS